MTRIAVPIPVRGRHPLLRLTVDRIKRQAGCEVHVVCVGGEDDCEYCRDALGVEAHHHDNYPLGAKWQFAFAMCRQYQPDAVLFLGSSDWVCDDWCRTMYADIQATGCGMIGKRSIDFLDVGRDGLIRGLRWNGYHLGSGREDEPIGAGRLLSRQLLDAIDWQAFDRNIDFGLDYSMLVHSMRRGSVYLSNRPEMRSASISCYAWQNKHNFAAMLDLDNCHWYECDELTAVVDGYFPEIKTLYKAINQESKCSAVGA
jgi:hypothetical protein